MATAITVGGQGVVAGRLGALAGVYGVGYMGFSYLHALVLNHGASTTHDWRESDSVVDCSCSPCAPVNIG